MKKIYFLFFIVISSLCLAAQEAAQQLDELVAAYAKNEKFNGTVLVAQKGKILLQKGHGYKNAGKKLMNDGKTDKLILHQNGQHMPAKKIK